MHSLARDALFAAWIEGDALPALCATRRLADDLVHDYARQRSRRGDIAWPAPDCLAWRAWLIDRFESLTQQEAMVGKATPRLLTDSEAVTLWHRIVSEASQHHPLLQTPRMAQLAADAWQTAHDHHLALPVGDPDDEDASAFDRWAVSFHSRLQQLDAITCAELPARLASALRSGRLDAPPRLAIAALDRPTPAQAHLLDALAECGTELVRVDSAQTGAPAITYLPCADRAAERDVVARQLREIAQAQPNTRIGVVVPDLALQRTALERAFDAVLCPWLAPGDDPARRPYSISQGAPLSAQPVIAAALDWLRWAASPEGVKLPLASRVLHAPFWSGSGKLQAVSRADRRLREARIDPVTLGGAARALSQPSPELAQCLRDAVLGREHALPSQWAQQFAATLHAVGWPGSLDSAAYQAHRVWNEQLSAFGRLDALSGSLSARAALGRLRDQLQQQIFQPQGGNARIQVLGVLEAAGLRFDRLFVLGLDETQWPPEARPVPLLPERLQRRAGIPQATAEGQLARARAITADLLAAAPSVTLSWPVQVDEQPARCSPVLPDTSATPPPAQAEHAPVWQQQHARRCSEAWQDDHAEPPPRDSALSGGVQRLGEHAECPFRALAHYGLAADAPLDPDTAPDAMERGILAHEVMATLWRGLRTSEQLHALDEKTQATLVEDAVAQHLAAWRQRAPHRATEGVLAVEGIRLQRHANALLTADRAREPFIVEWLEGALIDQVGHIDHSIELHGLSLRVRPDRIDHVPGYGRIVIDYKTGRTSTPVAHTLNAPQLAVYAALLEDCVGVAYATLRAGATGYVGLIDNGATAALPALTPVHKLRGAAREALDGDDWSAVHRLWDAQLGTIARGLQSGDARVEPLPGVCPRCDLQAFCRIHGYTAVAGDGEEATS
ncbi:MAG: PD-(D/E)XK nuclease family protein [Algiphilus sp.]